MGNVTPHMTDTELPEPASPDSPDIADTDLPGAMTGLAFHGPLSEARAARLVERLTRAHPATVLDIGCGWGELMLRVLAATAAATGVGLDLHEGDLARGRDNAKARGLQDRVTFARESGIGTTRDPADLVLCVGASHALSDVEPPGHLPEALRVLRRLVTPGGRVLLGDGFWQRPPTGAELAAMWPDASAGEYHDLAGLVDLATEAGFRPAWIEVASPQEWDEFESGYQSDAEQWLAAHSDHPRAAEIREQVDQHRSHWLRGYRDVLGLVYLTLVPVS
jgi:SAM-dependent methyltransferase